MWGTRPTPGQSELSPKLFLNFHFFQLEPPNNFILKLFLSYPAKEGTSSQVRSGRQRGEVIEIKRKSPFSPSRFIAPYISFPPTKPPPPFSSVSEITSNMDDEPKAGMWSKEVTRLWRAWRTVHEMVQDRVCAATPVTRNFMVYKINVLTPSLHRVTSLQKRKSRYHSIDSDKNIPMPTEAQSEFHSRVRSTINLEGGFLSLSSQLFSENTNDDTD